jgi:hypothetical protein
MARDGFFQRLPREALILMRFPSFPRRIEGAWSVSAGNRRFAGLGYDKEALPWYLPVVFGRANAR